jgi:hypothetical protein
MANRVSRQLARVTRELARLVEHLVEAQPQDEIAGASGPLEKAIMQTLALHFPLIDFPTTWPPSKCTMIVMPHRCHVKV